MAKAEKRSIGSFLWDYLTTVDHKKIGIMYILGGGVFFIHGGLEALIIRIQLLKPANEYISVGLLNQMLTMHATTMIFLDEMPNIVGLMHIAMPIHIS